MSVFLILIIVGQVFATYLNLQGKNNLFIFHIYTPVEFFVFTYILKSSIKSSLVKKIVNISMICFTLFCIYDMFEFETIYKFNSLPRGFEGILAIGFSLYFFYEIFVAEENIDLLKSSYFWLFSGWLIYFSGTFFLYIYGNHVGTNITYPIIHSILNIFLNLVYIYALWLGSRKLTS